MNKYLTYKEIEAIIGIVRVPKGFVPMSQDSYNETKIAQAVANTGQQELLLQCSINMATVGFGNKRYGNFLLNDQIIDIAKTLKNLDVKLNNQPGAQLKESDLTPQRLCRFFRHHIRDYIKENKISTYLFRKYTNRDPNFFEICFRGAEYLDDLTTEQFEYLYNATKNLDERLNTNISDRVNRVHEARLGMSLSYKVK